MHEDRKQEVGGRLAAFLPVTICMAGKSLILWKEASEGCCVIGINKIVKRLGEQGVDSDFVYHRAADKATKAANHTLATALAPFVGLYSPSVQYAMLARLGIIDPPPIADALRLGTRAVHHEIAKHPLIKSIQKAKITVDDYAQYLSDLFTVYRALETELGMHTDNPRLKGIFSQSVFRRDALSQDLKILNPLKTSNSWRAIPSTTACNYAFYLWELSTKRPYLLAAHAYVLYLGNFNGGQILSKAIQKMKTPAMAFYTFDQPSAILIKECKDALNALPLNASEIASLVAEANKAFNWNSKLLDAVTKKSG